MSLGTVVGVAETPEVAEALVDELNKELASPLIAGAGKHGMESVLFVHHGVIVSTEEPPTNDGYERYWKERVERIQTNPMRKCVSCGDMSRDCSRRPSCKKPVCETCSETCTDGELRVERCKKEYGSYESE